MSAIAQHTLVVVNPASAGGSTDRRWPEIQDRLRHHLDFEVAYSQYAGHAIELAGEARRSGYARLIAVGGDGTLNEVVHGAYSANSPNPMPALSLIPAGTGADFARTLAIPRSLEQACARLGDPRAVPSDLGVVSYQGGDGPGRRYFVNAAGLGYDAEVVNRRNGFNRYVRGTLPYLASLAATLLSYENKDISVTVDGASYRRRINAVVVAIGRFFGGGMRIAPNAEVSDGLFDVVTIGDVGRVELIYNLPGVYRGTHLRNPKISVERAESVRVDSDQRLLVQADGELLGAAPARFEIIPQAISFLT